MDNLQLNQFLVSALGGCIVGIGWWIANSLTGLNQKMEKVLIKIEAHEVKMGIIEARLKTQGGGKL